MDLVALVLIVGSAPLTYSGRPGRSHRSARRIENRGTAMDDTKRRKVLILGAAGRDFHDFNVVFRDDPRTQVVAFTAAQIPDIDGRPIRQSSPASCTRGIEIVPEDELEPVSSVAIRPRSRLRLLGRPTAGGRDAQASRRMAAGADFLLQSARGAPMSRSSRSR